MSKNPVVNAFGASAYIILVVSVMNFITQTLGDKPDTFFGPAVFLSLLTLSAAVMAFIFFYHPVQLLIEGKKKEAMTLFIRTVLIFGLITIAGLTLLFLGVI